MNSKAASQQASPTSGAFGRSLRRRLDEGGAKCLGHAVQRVRSALDHSNVFAARTLDATPGSASTARRHRSRPPRHAKERQPSPPCDAVKAKVSAGGRLRALRFMQLDSICDLSEDAPLSAASQLVMAPQSSEL